MSGCKHIERSQEAYCEIEDGEFVEAEVLLCGWADAFPERFMNAPRWLTQNALAGRPVHPERDCIGCPGYATPTTPNARDEG